MAMKFTYKGKTYRFKEGVLKKLLIRLVLIVAIIFAGVGIYHYATSDQESDVLGSWLLTPVKKPSSQYSGPETVLQKDLDAGQEYLDETLFLGDSNTARYVLSQDFKGNPYTTKNNTIGVVGMRVEDINYLQCMEFDTGLTTMIQAVKLIQPRRIIMTFGTNNLSGNLNDVKPFIEVYTKQIEKIQEAYPYADIIVTSIPPVSKKCVYPTVTMPQIDLYNEEILKMCEAHDWKYLDSSEALKDSETGFAKDGYTIQDGLHLSNEGLKAYFTYVRQHPYKTKDRRPTPLAQVPKIIGVKDHLIETNPLDDQEFENDPSSEGFETEEIPETLEECNGKLETTLLAYLKEHDLLAGEVTRIETEEKSLANHVAQVVLGSDSLSVDYEIYVYVGDEEEKNNQEENEQLSEPSEENSSNRDFLSQISE